MASPDKLVKIVDILRSLLDSGADGVLLVEFIRGGIICVETRRRERL